MSNFGKNMSSIYGTSRTGTAPYAGASATGAPTASTAPTSGGTAPASPAAGTPKTTAAAVDVAANLDALTKASKEKFDWRKSIVDLMKLLKLDSSLASRK